ncbi:MAG: Rieske (2Fe-2S) protein [Mycobacteriaceae bacterium]|nr:Rieske (2Fe-2S) protein [Mycobacteriaceae bacterium]
MDVPQLLISRQKVIFGAGLALAGAGLLELVAACTTNSKPAATSSPATSSPASAPAKFIAKTSDVPVGSGVIVDGIVVTQPSPGVFNGLSATCTHQGCTVSEVAGGTINCPCHGSKFNLDGSVARGPADRPLDAEAVVVHGDSIVRG